LALVKVEWLRQELEQSRRSQAVAEEEQDIWQERFEEVKQMVGPTCS
jgi:hypothetical protein